MIGDGLSDVEAGRQVGLKTVFLAVHKCDTCQTALRKDLRPTLWADTLWSAAEKIIHSSSPS
jgi:phosphoglycolate phosphatase-like HAD superfamily hydrolase